MPRFRGPEWAWLLAVGVFAVAVNALVVTLNPPVPRIHDEFSYLLSADTFRSGRLTNPTHAHWPHFETMHVIHQPSYASKYPPGRGLLLAGGWLAIGTPLAGVCFATGLATVACVWMLRAWMPLRWAMIGGLLVALHTGVQLQWGASYWGGGLAMAAGATAIGASARLAAARLAAARQLLLSSTLLGVAAVALAVTRPFEGVLLLAGSSLVVGVSWLRGEGTPWGKIATRVLPPLGVIGAFGIAGLLAYNHAVTGEMLRMPYQVHESEYGATPLFLWQTPDTGHTYRHQPLARYHLAASMWWYDHQQSLSDLVTMKAWLTKCSLEFFLATPVALALLATGWVRRQTLWPWLGVGLVVWAVSCGAVWMFPHYLAPAAPLLLLALVAGLRSLRTIERRLPSGRRWITPSLLVLHAVVFAFAAIDYAKRPRSSWAHARAAFAQKLQQTPGDDLVFVHYADDHNVHDEWVYNRADIDNAPIVWAREISESADDRLRNYFADRNAWTVYADEQPIRIEPRNATPPAIANAAASTPLAGG
ncbi:MAG: hypothetical protein AAGJ46_16820 [Planctomycetota bacterium]